MTPGGTIRIRNGAVWDPRHGRRGEIGDVCIENGRVVASLPPTAPVFDAKNLLVVPGGVDLHSHITGGGVRAARLLCPEAAGGPCLPALDDIGRLYARLGYTTVFDAAVAPAFAADAHDELASLPILDGGFFLLMGNDPVTLEACRDADPSGLAGAVASLLDQAGAYAPKLVNPGGVAAWKEGREEPSIEEAGTILSRFASAAAALRLPHPLHVHLPRLGVPGNATATLALIESFGGRRAHVTHTQFHAYGGRTFAGFRSRAPEIAAALNRSPHLTADVGQVVFGPAVTLSADGPAQERLHRASHRKWLHLDIEGESACGVVPHEFKAGNLVASVQWAAGLELMLLVDDPWRMALTTDHPNGGPFAAYPTILRMLAERGFREEILRRAHPLLPQRSHLAGIAREYSFEELLVVTRSGPARVLGLDAKGHLGPGADGDVALLRRADDIETTFAEAVAVFKDGRLVAREGEILDPRPGRRIGLPPASRTPS
ncbi:MAG TPA: formylmethanofuran dehydrogenase subunit A [Candidatus Polarisedimenticolia bacterium]|nr:formylmethanofuran dehydrogenase subunit A [Candidatus Polarisedimenticolia bacterium]